MFLSCIWCLALNFGHPAVLVYLVFAPCGVRKVADVNAENVKSRDGAALTYRAQQQKNRIAFNFEKFLIAGFVLRATSRPGAIIDLKLNEYPKWDFAHPALKRQMKLARDVFTCKPHRYRATGATVQDFKTMPAF